MNSRLLRVQDWRALAREARYNVRRLAWLVRVTPRQLQRFFVETQGMTPREWLQELRRWRAQELLASGRTLKETAVLLCFSDTPGLCRLLRRAPAGAKRGSLEAEMSDSANKCPIRPIIGSCPEGLVGYAAQQSFVNEPRSRNCSRKGLEP